TTPSRTTDPFTWQRVWLYQEWVHAATSAGTSTMVSGGYRMSRWVSYGWGWASGTIASSALHDSDHAAGAALDEQELSGANTVARSGHPVVAAPLGRSLQHDAAAVPRIDHGAAARSGRRLLCLASGALDDEVGGNIDRGRDHGVGAMMGGG